MCATRVGWERTLVDPNRERGRGEVGRQKTEGRTWKEEVRKEIEREVMPDMVAFV